MKNHNEIEKILLKDSEYEDLIKTRVENEFNEVINPQNEIKEKIIVDIDKVPKDKIFSKYSVFEVINKNSKSKSYINGLQAEGYLGSNILARKNILSGKVNYFIKEDTFIKFSKCKL